MSKVILRLGMLQSPIMDIEESPDDIVKIAILVRNKKLVSGVLPEKTGTHVIRFKRVCEGLLVGDGYVEFYDFAGIDMG